MLRGDWIRSGRDVRGLMIKLGDHNSLQGKIQVNGKPITSDTLRTGRFSQSNNEIDASRSHWWLVFMLAIQLILVAFPEEYFFRGYLQGRLDERFTPRWRILGVQLGPGWILSSVAFALLHPILIPGVHRLLVFFPSLLFGWLKARTGSIGAAVLVHAFSNILLAMAGQMYIA
jgi:membrane protease YdiL (CAAX protease family)